MNCKHKEIKGNTTKYFACRVKDKAISENDCKNCLLRLPDFLEVFSDLFRGINGNKRSG